MKPRTYAMKKGRKPLEKSCWGRRGGETLGNAVKTVTVLRVSWEVIELQEKKKS